MYGIKDMLDHKNIISSEIFPPRRKTWRLKNNMGEK